MDKKIEVNVVVDPLCEKPNVIIMTKENSELVRRIIDAIKNLDDVPKKIMVYSGDKSVLLNRRDIFRAYIENRKLQICTESETYISKLTLYELESLLNEDGHFARISRFEIVNLKKISSFDMSVAGTIKIIFENGTMTWVSRRFVREIQNRLSILEDESHA